MTTRRDKTEIPADTRPLIEKALRFMQKSTTFVDNDPPIYRCRCLDTALVLVDDTTHHGEYRPCADCNPRGHVLWLGGHWKPEHRGCSECNRTNKRAPGASHYDETKAERAERNSGYQRREREDLY